MDYKLIFIEIVSWKVLINLINISKLMFHLDIIRNKTLKIKSLFASDF